MSENPEKSDNSDSEIVKPIKQKKQISDSKLAQLASARAKALEKKKILKDIADEEKQMKNDILNDRINEVKAYDEFKNKVVSKKESKNKKVVEVESDSSYDSYTESESSSEDEKPPPKNKKQKQVTYFGTKNPKSNHALTAEIAKDELKRRIQNKNFNIAFQSLFPCHRQF
jgi:nucleolin